MSKARLAGRAARSCSRWCSLSYTLRPARPPDAPALCAAERQIAQVPGQLASHPEELKPENFEQKIRALTDNPRGIYLVAERAGEPVAHALLEPLPLKALRHVVQLTIAVHEGNQGQGIGDTLMRALIDWARQAPEVEKIELNVRSGNDRAMALYRKLGFAEEGRRLRRLKAAPGQYLDDVMMALFVD